MTAHYEPPSNEIVQRCKFFSRNRRPHESIAEYNAQIKQLVEHCKFGDKLSEMLRDRLVFGVVNQKWQQKLLSEEGLTYEKALKLLTAMEVSEKEAKTLDTKEEVHRLHHKGHLSSQSGSHRPRQGSPLSHHKPHQGSPFSRSCYRCGGNHNQADCRFINDECHYCHKKGHIAPVCHKKARDFRHRKRSSPPPQKQQQQSSVRKPTHKTDTEEVLDEIPEYDTLNCRSPSSKPILVDIEIHETTLTMEVDTGATLSIISRHTYNTAWTASEAPPLKTTSAKLRTYTGEEIPVDGAIEVDVVYQSQKATLSLLVVAGNGPSLMGRDWLQHFKLNWTQLHQVKTNPQDELDRMLLQHKDLFKNELGKIKDVTAKLLLKSNAKPRFYRARPVPFSVRAKVDAEIDRQVDEGILEPVQFSEWATPIVPVMKPNGSVRLCGDYKLTVNQETMANIYPLPRIEDIHASLAGGKFFSKLDLSHAYQQIPLDEESKKFVTINTLKGLYKINRLPFGVSSAPSMFQRVMEGILHGIPGVCVYIDDILISGKTTQEYLQNLVTVLLRLAEAGIRLKREKCFFMLSSVEYLGYRISAAGLQPTPEKVDAIQRAPAPTDVSQLKSFLGIVNYYGKFLPNLSTVLAPLYRLLQKEAKWVWSKEQQTSFDKVNSLLTSDSLLVHYDLSRKLILACDASPYGIGAVLSHREDNGQEKPIAFASRSLGVAEKKYSQLEKEGLAIIFAVKRFHQYLFGRHFTILSDHKPLQHIFGETRATPTMASARIQRWALLLGGYDYCIAYKPGQHHANADLLSCLPLPETPAKVPIPPETVLVFETFNSSSTSITAAQISKWTAEDSILLRVKDLVQHGWRRVPNDIPTSYRQCQEELSLQDGCVLRGNRVIIPPVGRNRVMDFLHEGHPGTTRMKALARSFVWWPGIDHDIQDKVKRCDSCQRVRHNPPSAPLHPWEFPKRPWERLHADFAGSFEGKMFLIVVDAFSKWLEVKPLSAATSTVTIEHLRSIFATHSLPETFVTDNGSQFTSAEFKFFMENNGIRHVTSSPYHPASNWLAERSVQTFKEHMKKTPDGSLETHISRFLFWNHLTPHTTTGVSPAELLLERVPRSLLDLLKPKSSEPVQQNPQLADAVMQKQQKQKENHDNRLKLREFVVDDPVFVKDFPGGRKWITGTVSTVKGPLSYHVTLTDGRVVRRHVDHIRIRTSTSVDDDPDPDLINFPTSPTPAAAPAVPTTTPPTVQPRRSTRNTNPPDWLRDYVCTMV